ncbi:MAG TPA: periplasmic heavy metal sensor [Alphaproteobacteria bacterium]|nr:periplasmic heavy metal sensor [Alphaproteobacteria bacterium]
MTRRLRLLLIASLALNLALGGLLAGGAIRQWAWGGHGGEAPMRGLMRVLPAESHEAARAALAAGRPEMEARLAALRDARRELVAALAREPYDRAAVEAAFAALRARTAEVQAQAHGTVAGLAAGLGPEQRRRLGQAVAGPAGRPAGGGVHRN